MGIYCPRNTIIVTCREKEFDDAVTLSWHSPASMNPLLYTIFLAGKRKSLEMIKESREFCVNFPTEDMGEMALFCGTNSGRDMDKFKEGKIGKEECESINCPRIKGCSAYMECRMKDIVEVGDHFMIVGEVVKKVEGSMKKKLMQSNISGTFKFSSVKEEY